MTFRTDEKCLFLDAMEGVTPLKDSNTMLLLKPPAAKSRHLTLSEEQLDNPLTAGFVDSVPLTQPLTWSAEGIQPGVLNKLRLGKYAQQATLNLLQLNVEQCREAVYTFILHARRNNLRNLLIVHGKARRDTSRANLIRSYLLHWLPCFDDVQAICAAQAHHGGSGACYVSLRKSDQARLDNRERQARRGR